VKIYTRTGDKGETGLFAGGRVRKDHSRVAAYGTVDELNAAIGLARALGVDDAIDAGLARIQGELFCVGADLATPLDKTPGWLQRLDESTVAALEGGIDAMDAELEPLKYFVLPGGSKGGAALHVARTVCRRAEREVVALGAGEAINAVCLHYLNRLSDWLFVAARLENARSGCPELVWQSDQ
jgi:cob(I)alamin adenosyltransferase